MGTGSPLDPTPSTAFAPIPERPPARTLTPPPLRRLRLALRISAWSITLTAVAAAIGVLLFIHRGDAEGAARIANREIGFVLERSELVLQRAPVLQRNWYEYFRVTHGVLAATDRRLVFVGVPPEPLLPREEEPRELEEASFPYDRPIEARRSRLFFGTLPGLVVRAPGQSRAFVVSSRREADVGRVLAEATRRQTASREAEERERQAALAAAVAARLPFAHVVRRGEALELIARLYNVAVDDLRLWNGLSDSGIRAGDRLVVKPWS